MIDPEARNNIVTLLNGTEFGQKSTENEEVFKRLRNGRNCPYGKENRC